MMNSITIVGLVAAVFTTIALLPQLLKVWRTKSTRDISTGMFSFYCIGVFLWFVYGVFIGDLPIILANSIAFVQGAAILLLKAKYS
jgi:MtN3 and saliva related transmembrane protein